MHKIIMTVQWLIGKYHRKTKGASIEINVLTNNVLTQNVRVWYWTNQKIV